jgi:hypothetical protein
MAKFEYYILHLHAIIVCLTATGKEKNMTVKRKVERIK